MIGRREVIPASVAAHAALLAFLVVTARNARTMHEYGHDWGDDFSLYVHQARSIGEGNSAEVIASTRFNVLQSGWPFSPNGYPWGFPLVLSPFVLLWGLDLYKLKLVTTGLFIICLALFFRFLRPRTGSLGALAIVGVVGTNYFYVGWTGSILSEFCFWASVLVSLMILDRFRKAGAWRDPSPKLAILAGLSLAWTMNVRREGLGLLLGVAAIQLIEGVARRRDPVAATMGARQRLVRIGLPFGVFAAAMAGFQLLLPTDLLPNAQKSGPQFLGRNLTLGKKFLGEHVGLRDPGDGPFRWMHNPGWGAVAIQILLVLGLLGILARLLLAIREDGWLIAAVLGHAYIVFTAPSSEGRYYYALSPWAVYFAFQALPTIAASLRSLDGRRWAFHGTRLVATVGVGCLIASNLPEFRNAVSYHREYSYIENGPDSPDAVQMFDAVRRLTRPSDVVLFFRSRAMNLYTNRRSVQNSDLKRMSTIADWYVMAKGSSYSQTLVLPEQAAALGLEAVWENATWVLWRFTRVPVPAIVSSAGPARA